MNRKFTKEEKQEIIKLIIKERAKEEIGKFFDSSLPWKERLENGFYGFGYYLVMWGTWVFRNYRWVKENLKINITWVIIVLISVWILANLFHAAPNP
ncbi:MAG: hypothetical protein M1308_10595 [Actinobacteria bacterium]|nr:hypothetical protein [Actinomycetota bacterium]